MPKYENSGNYRFEVYPKTFSKIFLTENFFKLAFNQEKILLIDLLIDWLPMTVCGK